MSFEPRAPRLFSRLHQPLLMLTCLCCFLSGAGCDTAEEVEKNVSLLVQVKGGTTFNFRLQGPDGEPLSSDDFRTDGFSNVSCVSEGTFVVTPSNLGRYININEGSSFPARRALYRGDIQVVEGYFSLNLVRDEAYPLPINLARTVNCRINDRHGYKWEGCHYDFNLYPITGDDFNEEHPVVTLQGNNYSCRDQYLGYPYADGRIGGGSLEDQEGSATTSVDIQPDTEVEGVDPSCETVDLELTTYNPTDPTYDFFTEQPVLDEGGTVVPGHFLNTIAQANINIIDCGNNNATLAPETPMEVTMTVAGGSGSIGSSVHVYRYAAWDDAPEESVLPNAWHPHTTAEVQQVGGVPAVVFDATTSGMYLVGMVDLVPSSCRSTSVLLTNPTDGLPFVFRTANGVVVREGITRGATIGVPDFSGSLTLDVGRGGAYGSTTVSGCTGAEQPLTLTGTLQTIPVDIQVAAQCGAGSGNSLVLTDADPVFVPADGRDPRESFLVNVNVSGGNVTGRTQLVEGAAYDVKVTYEDEIYEDLLYATPGTFGIEDSRAGGRTYDIERTEDGLRIEAVVVLQPGEGPC